MVWGTILGTEQVLNKCLLTENSPEKTEGLGAAKFSDSKLCKFIH